jgi:hypothetical protein
VLRRRAHVPDYRRTAVDSYAEPRPVRPPRGDGLGRIGECECGARRAQRVIRLVGRCVEDDHHRVAGKPLDHPVLGLDDRHDLRPVRVEHGDDLWRGRPLGESREALEVREENTDVSLLASELRSAGLIAEARPELGREVWAKELLQPLQFPGRVLEQSRLFLAHLVALADRVNRSLRPGELSEGLGVPLTDQVRCVFEKEICEDGRARTAAAVFVPRGQGNDSEGGGHQHVPLPPGRMPVAAEGDRGHRLCQQGEGRRDGQRHCSSAPPVEEEIASPCVGVQRDSQRREGVDRAVGLGRRESTIERREAGE